MIFKVRDYNSIPVILSKETWNKKLLDPIFGHPEVKLYLTLVKNTIKNPDYIYQSIRDSRSKLFYAKIPKGNFASYFLAVVVNIFQKTAKLLGLFRQ